MYKKALLLAILALTSTAASNEDSIREILFAKASTQHGAHRTKRSPDTCVAIKCGKKGDECDINTRCMSPADCRDSICRTPIAGDDCYFDSECHNESLYCGLGNTCKEYDKEGDPCVHICHTKSGETPLVCDPSTSKCTMVKADPWEPCVYGTACQGGSVCTAQQYAKGVCAIIPGIVGASCNVTYGCDLKKYLYCNSETSKCAELPKEGEACVSLLCNKGLRCDLENNTCSALGDVGEDCILETDCMEGLTCSLDRTCQKESPEEGEYCDNHIVCDDDHMCVSNICVKKDGTCKNDGDCAGVFSYCDNGKCKGNMGNAEGEKCRIYSQGEMSYLSASMECKEGLGCVPKAKGNIDGICKKVTAKGGNACESDEDCPSDAFCACNDEIGQMQCIPIPTSSKDFAERTVNFENALKKCFAVFVEEGEEAYTKCLAKDSMSYYEYIQSIYNYSADYRCVDISSLVDPTSSSSSSSSDDTSDEGSASSVQISVVAVIVTLLFAIFF